jgi:hypothetical protein
MIIIFTLISIILIFLGFYAAYKQRYDRSWDYENGVTIPCFLFGFIGIVICTVAAIFLIANLVRCKTIEQKIEVLTENNTQLEEKIYTTLQTYCEYEGKTLVDISPDNPEVILLIYPELKANVLFESYILTLKSNNETIKNLKVQKIDESIYKWWLYFGRETTNEEIN